MIELIFLIGWIGFVVICGFICYFLFFLFKGFWRALDFRICFIWCVIKLEKFDKKYVFYWIKMFFLEGFVWSFDGCPDEIRGKNWGWKPGWETWCHKNVDGHIVVYEFHLFK